MSKRVEDIKDVQLTVAQGLGVTDKGRELLEEIAQWQLRHECLISLLDAVPIDSIKEIVEKGAGAEGIKVLRRNHLREQLVNLEPLGIKLKELEKEVEGMSKESGMIREVIETKFESAYAQQQAAQKEALKAKDQVIDLLRGQLDEIKNRKTIHASSPLKLREGKKSKAQGKGLFSYLKKAEAEQFIELFFKGQDYSEEQKNFFIDCLERGLSVKEIQRFAAPGLSVAHMKRIRDLDI